MYNKLQMNYYINKWILVRLLDKINIKKKCISTYQQQSNILKGCRLKYHQRENSLAVQWLEPLTFTAEDPGVWELRSHKLHNAAKK